MAATLDEYDLLIYPGFMRRPMARWNEDGSCAPMARARGPKGEAFQLMLKQSEIDEDISHIEHEVRSLPPSSACVCVFVLCMGYFFVFGPAVVGVCFCFSL